MGGWLCKETPNISMSCDNNGIVNSCCSTESDRDLIKLYRWEYTLKEGLKNYKRESHHWHTTFHRAETEGVRHLRSKLPHRDAIVTPEMHIYIYEWSVHTASPTYVVSKKRLI